MLAWSQKGEAFILVRTNDAVRDNRCHRMMKKLAIGAESVDGEEYEHGIIPNRDKVNTCQDLQSPLWV